MTCSLCALVLGWDISWAWSTTLLQLWCYLCTNQSSWSTMMNKRLRYIQEPYSAFSCPFRRPLYVDLETLLYPCIAFCRELLYVWFAGFSSHAIRLSRKYYCISSTMSWSVFESTYTTFYICDRKKVGMTHISYSVASFSIMRVLTRCREGALYKNIQESWQLRRCAHQVSPSTVTVMCTSSSWVLFSCAALPCSVVSFQPLLIKATNPFEV